MELVTLGTLPDGGGRYNPGTDTWVPTGGGPTRRYLHTAVWTGSEMIVWGGFPTVLLNTGARYNPSTDSWAATTISNCTYRPKRHTAVWTGNQMIVWGGLDFNGTFEHRRQIQSRHRHLDANYYH